MQTEYAEYLELSVGQLAIAASLIVISGVISLLLQLGLERRLLWAGCRTVVQLSLLGLVLQWIFEHDQWYFVIALMLAMTLVAGVAAVRRAERRYAGLLIDSVLAIWVGSWCITATAVFGVVQVPSEYLAQYAIPLLGMILHNTLNGISLGIDRFGSELAGKRDEVETLLALGATRWEAARGPIQQAVRTGMIPTLNTMMVVGLVSIPGMMTGQLLAGVKPLHAATYQMVIMFLIAAGTSLGTMGVVLLGYRRLFTPDHQFLPGRLVKQG
ncbi:MAG: ABC transporter permease [Planctomycetota bacterium]|jgi:putative ABC transport system permease protein